MIICHLFEFSKLSGKMTVLSKTIYKNRTKDLKSK